MQLNRRLAAAGVLLVFLAVAVGSGAFTAGDELTDPDAQGSVFFSPADTPTGNAYADFDDDEITVTVDRLNPQAETLIDELFDVGYEGEDVAEVWVEHPSDSVTFYDETGSPIENETEDDRILLGSGDVAPIGMSVDTRGTFEVVEQVTLVALLPTDEEDIEVSPPPGDGGGGGVVQPDPEPEPDPDPTVDRSRLDVDLGSLNVQFRQPDFEYTADVPERDVNVLSPGLAGALLTAVDDDAPAPEETVVVESTVENTGNRGGTTAANLMVNGRVIETREVELGPGESKELSFVVGFDEPGQYEVAVGNAEPVTVFVTAIGFNWIPWAVAAAIISLISISLIYRRWKENEEAEATEGEDGGQDG